MPLGKYPLKFSTRLKQFLCKHETMSRSAFTEGINRRKGWHWVVYGCGKCELCVGKWEKVKDW